jgi:glutamate-1-semialdehyde 2,1-aminomutase
MAEPFCFDISKSLFQEAKRFLAGGVDSPVRAFRGVGGTPVFIRKGQGCRIYDEDNNEYIDYVLSWGPIIAGHGNPRVIGAMSLAMQKGTSFGAPTKEETELAHMICDAIPSMELMRFVNSGTEAVMSALRLARAFTGRDKIIKLIGCYHGHWDGVLVKAGSGSATLGVPDSAGVPEAFAQNTLVAPYNDLEAIRQLFEAYPKDIAALILEPVAANMGVVLPKPGYLQGLRKLTEEHGALLIFDEVITGFRLTYGSVQSIYGVKPDILCLGKIIGGGMPVGAYGGRRDIMEMVAPDGPVYQAGTLSGNPVAMAAGLVTLRIMAEPGTYDSMEPKAEHLAMALKKAADSADVPMYVSRAGSMFTTFFTSQEVTDYETAATSNLKMYSLYFHGMLKRGIYIAPSQFEACFLSIAHGDDEIATTIKAARQALIDISKSRCA